MRNDRVEQPEQSGITDRSETTNIVFLDRDTIGPAVDINRPVSPHSWTEYQRTSENEVVERLMDAHVAIVNKVPLGAEVLARLPKLKMISVAATGYDIIDLAACSQRGIVVSNVRGYAVHTVPEHAFSLILALSRSLPGFRQDVLDGEWQRARQFCFFNHPIRELAGSRIGILGEGAIGQRVAAIARAFGMDPVFSAHKGVSGLGPLYTPWDEVLATSDVLTLHAPLLPSTRHMISTPEFEAMKRKPLVINTSRGGLVDETSLVDALDRELISGAGFDVLTSEPPNDNHPLMAIADRPNVIVTPHIAWASNRAMQTLWGQVVRHIDNFIAGSPTNVVRS